MTTFALLGGSFDPIHNGHLRIARHILESGIADTVAFVPNARHNFKKDSVKLDFPTRLELVKAVLEPNIEAWDDDAAGTGYTADLMRRVYAKYPQAAFYFIIGSDNLANLSAWHDYPWLRQNVRFLIIPRPGYPLQERLLKRIRRKTLKMEPCELSSTRIRQLIAGGKPISGLVPIAIEERVVGLYKPLREKR